MPDMVGILHWCGELGFLGNVRFLFTFKFDWPVDLRGILDGQSFALFVDAAADGPGDVRRLVENQQVAADFSVNAQSLGKGSNAAPDSSASVQVNHLSPDHQIAFHVSGDGDVVAEAADVAVHLAFDTRTLHKQNDVAGNMSADRGFLPPDDQVAVNRAVHADFLAGGVDIALHGFILGNFNAGTGAEFRGRG